MAEIINLRKARKAKARAAKEKLAGDNRVAFGTPTALKDLNAARREKAQRDLDGHRRDKTEDED